MLTQTDEDMRHMNAEVALHVLYPFVVPGWQKAEVEVDGVKFTYIWGVERTHTTILAQVFYRHDAVEVCSVGLGTTVDEARENMIDMMLSRRKAP